MTTHAYCIMCSGRPPLVFDIAPSMESANAFTVYAYCDCGRIYQHDFVDSANSTPAQSKRFVAKPLSTTGVQVIDLTSGSSSVHEFDLNDDDVCCEYHDEADGYDLQGIKQEIAERTALLMASMTR